MSRDVLDTYAAAARQEWALFEALRRAGVSMWNIGESAQWLNGGPPCFKIVREGRVKYPGHPTAGLYQTTLAEPWRLAEALNASKRPVSFKSEIAY